jgi:hypothetical protein
MTSFSAFSSCPARDSSAFCEGFRWRFLPGEGNRSTTGDCLEDAVDLDRLDLRRGDGFLFICLPLSMMIDF